MVCFDVWVLVISKITDYPLFFLLMSTCKTIKDACELQRKRFGTREIRRGTTCLEISFWVENKILFSRRYTLINKTANVFVVENEKRSNVFVTFWPEKYTRRIMEKSIPFSFKADNRKSKETLNLFYSWNPKQGDVLTEDNKVVYTLFYDRKGNLQYIRENKGEGIGSQKIWTKDGNVVMIERFTRFHHIPSSIEFPNRKVTFNAGPYSRMMTNVVVEGEQIELIYKNKKKINAKTMDPIFLLALEVIPDSNHCYIGAKKEDEGDVCFECEKPIGQVFISDHELKFHIPCCFKV
jgi:hypothetical protein